MKRESRPSPEPVAQLQRQLEQFRRTRPGRTKLPESLWQAAVELARQHGVYPVAHPLGLDYTRLKERLGGSPTMRRKATKPVFVELVAPSRAQLEEYVIEFESALRGLANVILTPHVGGSTQEAQEEIGFFVSGKLSSFAHGGSTALSVNLPEVAAPRLETGFRIALLHHNIPGVLASVNQVFADQQANVTAQYLATRGEQGLVVTDVDAELPESVLDGLRSGDSTIWLRTYVG